MKKAQIFSYADDGQDDTQEKKPELKKQIRSPYSDKAMQEEARNERISNNPYSNTGFSREREKEQKEMEYNPNYNYPPIPESQIKYQEQQHDLGNQYQQQAYEPNYNYPTRSQVLGAPGTATRDRGNHRGKGTE